MKNTVLIGTSIVAVVLVVGGATTWLVAGRPDRARTRAIGSETVASSSTGSNRGGGDDRGGGDERAELRRRLAELELKVGTLSEQGAPPSSEETAKAQDAQQGSEPLSSEEQVKHDEAVWEDHMAEVALNFEAETRDGRWAQNMANIVTQRVQANATMRAAFKQVECRSVSCRVELIDDQKGEFNRQWPVFVTSLNREFPSGEVRTVDNPDGTKTLNVYFSSTMPDSAARGG